MYFKTVPDFPGYLCDSIGNVYSLKQGGFKKLSSKKRGPYPRTKLFKNGKRFNPNTHRVIIISWRGLPSNKEQTQVNHINGIKDDNRLFNLEWSSPQENSMHACRVLKKGIGGLNGESKLTEKQVLEIRASHLKNIELAKIYSVTPGNIGHIKKIRKWRHL